MQPKDITYTTNLAEVYRDDLQLVNGPIAFKLFLEKWSYWLDPKTKNLSALDWERIKPLINDCRDEEVVPEDKHMVAISLLIPKRIFKISVMAVQAKVPWGVVYLRMRELKKIDY